MSGWSRKAASQLWDWLKAMVLLVIHGNRATKGGMPPPVRPQPAAATAKWVAPRKTINYTVMRRGPPNERTATKRVTEAHSKSAGAERTAGERVATTCGGGGGGPVLGSGGTGDGLGGDSVVGGAHPTVETPHWPTKQIGRREDEQAKEFLENVRLTLDRWLQGQIAGSQAEN